MTVISNATPLINFAAINRLDILKAVFEKIIIPQAVYEETTLSSFPHSQLIIQATQSNWLNVYNVTLKMNNLSSNLDRGEQEVIALAIERNNYKVLLDEKEARQIAKELKLQIIGTLGVLLLAKKKQVVPTIRPLLDNMINVAQYWVSESLYQQVLKQAGE